VPRLVRAGYEVVALSRGERSPYHEAPEWRAVQRVSAGRDAEDAAGTFGDRGLAAGAAGWFGRQPALDLVDWTDFEERVGSAHAGVTRHGSTAHPEQGCVQYTGTRRLGQYVSPRY
jgi:hypothetical protein